MKSDEFSMELIKDADKYIITDINIDDENMKKVSLKMIVNDSDYFGNLIESNYNIKSISCIMNNYLYIFENCMLSSFDVTIGDADSVLDAEISIITKDMFLYDILKVKFTDSIHKINAVDIYSVYKEYGNPEKMSYNEFCQKCLAVKI